LQRFFPFYPNFFLSAGLTLMRPWLRFSFLVFKAALSAFFSRGNVCLWTRADLTLQRTMEGPPCLGSSMDPICVSSTRFGLNYFGILSLCALAFSALEHKNLFHSQRISSLCSKFLDPRSSFPLGGGFGPLLLGTFFEIVFFFPRARPPFFFFLLRSSPFP